MDTTQQAGDLHVSRTDHDDGWTVAVDCYPLTAADLAVDVVEETLIVAVDTPTLRTEFDVGLPGAGGTVSFRNGVAVVEGGG
jgi:hypothetical protein